MVCARCVYSDVRLSAGSPTKAPSQALFSLLAYSAAAAVLGKLSKPLKFSDAAVADLSLFSQRLS